MERERDVAAPREIKAAAAADDAGGAAVPPGCVLSQGHQCWGHDPGAGVVLVGLDQILYFISEEGSRKRCFFYNSRMVLVCFQKDIIICMEPDFNHNSTARTHTRYRAQHKGKNPQWRVWQSGQSSQDLGATGNGDRRWWWLSLQRPQATSIWSTTASKTIRPKCNIQGWYLICYSTGSGQVETAVCQQEAWDQDPDHSNKLPAWPESDWPQTVQQENILKVPTATSLAYWQIIRIHSLLFESTTYVVPLIFFESLRTCVLVDIVLSPL